VTENNLRETLTLSPSLSTLRRLFTKFSMLKKTMNDGCSSDGLEYCKSGDCPIFHQFKEAMMAVGNGTRANLALALLQRYEGLGIHKSPCFVRADEGLHAKQDSSVSAESQMDPQSPANQQAFRTLTAIAAQLESAPHALIEDMTNVVHLSDLGIIKRSGLKRLAQATKSA
jgi:hypothetical protein